MEELRDDRGDGGDLRQRRRLPAHPRPRPRPRGLPRRPLAPPQLRILRVLGKLRIQGQSDLSRPISLAP